ncbi:M23 family metallopeptidase [Niabella sp. W65]|nr:M23 family metallopeptidase [Niabella sp. W65]MCH7368414.1 M23 family metallopeptidase [Niabella sp. W65]
MRENLAGFNVYYAHLDSFIVNSGDAVTRGDTLGFVGSTGNAAGGAPHLHFGIYGNNGAVDR